MRIGIITISDRSSLGQRADLSGPAIREVIEAQDWTVVRMQVIPDELQIIKEKLIAWSDARDLDIILTTGGTGFSARDVTPEATLQVIEREAPGMAEAMRAESLKVTPHAMMSRARVGIRGETLIVNLPGSPRGAVENLEVILPVLGHAVDLLSGDQVSEAGHQFDGDR